MITKSYGVTGLGCEACAKRVKNAVEKLDGVESCDVNLADESMTVRFDGQKVTEADLKSAVEDAGYGLKDQRK